jgi:hypothetical protein
MALIPMPTWNTALIISRHQLAMKRRSISVHGISPPISPRHKSSDYPSYRADYAIDGERDGRVMARLVRRS